jgi:cobalt/nickel transport system permease protein
VANLQTAQAAFNRLEDLAEGDSLIHRLHPSVKILVTMLYITLVLSFDRYNISGLLGFSFYPVAMLALSGIPYKPIFFRFLAALPFGLFGGLANIYYDTGIYYAGASFIITYGHISCAAILIKTLFTVTAALILIASTKIADISEQLVRFRLPPIFALSFIMTYRYISVLLEEVNKNYNAYTLRSGRKAIAMKDMGYFCGGLFLKSFDRAERIFSAMKCRGFNGTLRHIPKKTEKHDIVFMAGTASVLIILRFADLGAFFTRLFVAGGS